MDWVLKLFRRNLAHEYKKQHGDSDPTDVEIWNAFQQLFPSLTARLLVQEPYVGSIRFKWVAVYFSDEMGPLIENPKKFITENFGGGKFKLNFHQGMTFMATVNFKTKGPELWNDMEELQESEDE